MAKADVLKDAGNRYFKNEDYFRAIKCYKEGLQLDPGNPTINCNLAQAYLAVKEFAEAEVHAVVTLAHQADSVKGFYRATKAALGMAKRGRALSYLRTGLLNCPNAEELKTLYEEISKENGEAALTSETNTEQNSEKEENVRSKCSLDDAKKSQGNSERERPSRSDQNKLRSRSSGSRNRIGCKSLTEMVSIRSMSVNRSTNEKSLQKKGSGPKSDEFIDTLIKEQSKLSPEDKSPQQKQREALMEKQKKLQTCMKEGSEALEIGLAKQASEKYKCALDIMAECNIEVFGLPEVNRIILKYSLAICWIETLNYNNIVQSVGCLMEIETSHATELPAVYFGLGNAFFRLNRFKVALDHLDKGVKAIENCTDVIPHPWPGTMKTIVETTKMGFKESICKLCCECKTYREPDAVCRYEKCLTVSTHICPSEIIFYSDPDFVGYVVIICQENCKITYHVGCWKHYKENLPSVGKLTDKDVLGRTCLTSDCVNERNDISVIVRIEVYGEDGKIKTSCSKEPTKTDNVNENRKERKKKNEKIDKPVKIKVPRTRVRKLTTNTQNMGKKVKRKSTVSSEDFATCIQRLAELRSMNFRIAEEVDWNPQKDYFGRPDISALKTYLTSYSKDSDDLRERKDFIYTYFYEYLNDEGPQKTSTIEKKWHEEVSQFPGISEFISQQDGICEFLLQSYRFACIDDYLCLAHQLADTYQRVKEEVGESTTFILSHSSHDVGNESEVCGLVVNKCDHKLIQNTSPNSTVPTFHVGEHPDAAVAGSSREWSSEIPWNKRDSECDSYLNQDTSESSSEESDCNGMISTDSENEYCYERINIENYSYDAYDRTNVAHVLVCGTSQSSVPEKLIDDLCQTPTVLYSSSAGSVYQELSDIDIKDFQHNISDVAIQNVDLLSNEPQVLNADTQTDYHCDLEEEIEALKTTNNFLRQEVVMSNDRLQKLMCSFQEEVKDYKQKIQVYESRISSIVAEKEKNENEMQFQIEVRDSKIEAMKKNYEEQIDVFTKKKEEDACLLKTNLENMAELHKDMEKHTNTINRLEGQLRRANEQILNIRKLFGEYKLDSYLAKCKERLHCMNVMVQYFQDSGSPSIDGMKGAIEAWEHVAGELQDTRSLLEVQYDILSQQLKNKVSSDCLLQLELADLPLEPFYPLQDMNSVLHLAAEYMQQKKPSSNGKIVKEMDIPSHNMQYMENVSPSYLTRPLMGISAFPPQEIFSRRGTNSFGYRPPFFSNSFNALSRTIPTTQVGHHFNSHSSNETMNSAISRQWPSEFHGVPSRNDKSEHMVIGRSIPSLTNITPNFMDSIALKRLCGSIESVSSGESDSHGAGNKVLDRKEGTSVLPDVKQRDMFGEKKTNSTASSGLTPIETKSVVADVWGAVPKLTNSEIKQNFRAPKRWNYHKLFDEIQRNFRVIAEVELSECLFIVREKNGNKLSGLSVATIMHKVEKVLEERSSKKGGNTGMDKFGGTAWGDVKENDVNWQNDDIENECVICHINIDSHSKTSLQCKHTFHSECIRQWLHTNSTCPICRKYTRLIDEFPPLA